LFSWLLLLFLGFLCRQLTSRKEEQEEEGVGVVALPLVLLMIHEQRTTNNNVGDYSLSLQQRERYRATCETVSMQQYRSTFNKAGKHAATCRLARHARRTRLSFHFLCLHSLLSLHTAFGSLPF